MKLAKLWGNYSHTDGQRLTNGQWFKECRRFTQRDIQPYGKCGIREQALPKAAKAVEHISLIEVPEDDQKPSIVTIGRNTALEARISLEHDGTLRALDEHASTINLIHPGPKGSTRFDTIHKTVQRRARHALSYELASHLGITRNTALRNNTTTARRPLNIYMDKKVQKEMDRTAKIIAKEHLPQGCSDPGAHGYSILPSLMPKHKVKSALNIIGRRATIAHMRTLGAYEHILEEPARANPGAVMIAFTRDDLPNYIHDTPHTSRNILAFAKTTLLTWLSDREKEIGQTLWEIFTKLDTDTLREHLPLNNPATLTKICAAANRAEANPSPQALAYLITHPHHLSVNNSRLLSCFIRESTRLMGQGPGPQEQLVFRADAALRYANPHHPRRKHPHNPQPLLMAKGMFSKEPLRDWDQVNTLLPKWVTDANTQEQYEKLSKLLPTPRTMLHQLSIDQELAAVRGQAGDNLKLIAEESLAIHDEPGQRFAVHSPIRAYPILLAEKLPDGRIYLDQQTMTTIGSDTPERQPAVVYNPKQRLTHKHRLSPALTSTVQEAIRTNLRTHVRQYWKSITPDPHMPKPDDRTVERNILCTMEERDNNADHRAILPQADALLQQMLLAIQNMADPITWDQAARAAGVSVTMPITPFQYSTAATLDTQLEDLVKTNPGAVAWLLQTAGPAQADNESIKHPGQIITLARRTLEDKGLDHSHWRTATALDTDSMSFLALTEPASRVIKVISTLAMAGGTTGKRTTRLITKLIPIPQYPSSTIVPGVTLKNWDIAKVLLAKAANATVSLDEVRDLTEQFEEVYDYIRNTPEEHQQPITTTTWRGLVKAAQRWHREQRAISKEKKWQKALSEKGGRYLAWDSALDATEINGFQATPLTDEKQLHEETDRMGHCVYTYAETCANGTSRIFSLTRNGRPAGTSQITLKTKKWTEVQTRGINNHTPPPGSLETMQEISARYTLAHQGRGHAPPRLVDPETGHETPFMPEQ